MPLPKTLAELKAAGYEFKERGVCRLCPASIDWFLSPNKKLGPWNAMDAPTDEAKSHFATCPNAAAFRKKK